MPPSAWSNCGWTLVLPTGPQSRIRMIPRVFYVSVVTIVALLSEIDPPLSFPFSLPLPPSTPDFCSRKQQQQKVFLSDLANTGMMMRYTKGLTKQLKDVTH